jgi:hypothetical protein
MKPQTTLAIAAVLDGDLEGVERDIPRWGARCSR